jgi:hypothetical protein
VVGSLGSAPVCPSFAAAAATLWELRMPSLGYMSTLEAVQGEEAVQLGEAEAEVGSWDVFGMKAGALGYTAVVRPL